MVHKKFVNEIYRLEMKFKILGEQEDQKSRAETNARHAGVLLKTTWNFLEA